MSRLRDERGFTIIELLIVCLTLGIVLTGIVNVLVSGSRAGADADARFQAQQNDRLALDKLDYEARCASTAALVSGGAGVTLTFPSGTCSHVAGATTVPFARLREAALTVRDGLTGLGLPARVKTTGSRGLHVYVPIVRGPTQRDVWRFTKTLAVELAVRHPKLLTAEYRLARRPARRVLVDYNQNAWGRTLASVYSVRPSPQAAVSTPVTWEELARGLRLEDFRLDNVPARIRRRGDLWAPLLKARGRYDLAKLL